MNTLAWRESESSLLRRFGLASLVVIAAIAAGNSVLLSAYVSKIMLEREARVTMEFVQNVLRSDGSIGYFANPLDPGLERLFRGSIEHLVAIPDTQRINIYAADRSVLWSTDPAVIGEKYADNAELEAAFGGELVVEGGSISADYRRKAEHVGLNANSDYFVETYIPITHPGLAQVKGVVELYKAPVALTEVIRQGQQRVWLSACLGALVLYLTLFWIVRKAHHRILDQHTRLRQAETMAALGELAASVAHNIRNPLASIRATTELGREVGTFSDKAAADDITDSVDRIEVWLRDMVNLSQVDAAQLQPVDAAHIMQACFAAAADKFTRAGVHGGVQVDAQAGALMVRADAPLLAHVLHSILNNAFEACGRGGRVSGHVGGGGGWVRLLISDTGSGIAPQDADKLFSLFFTTKPNGMGIGLMLAKRAIESFGGNIRAENTPCGRGASFVIELPAA